MRYITTYPCQSQCCQCGTQTRTYTTQKNNTGLIILAAALLFIPFFAGGQGGFYY